MSVCLCTFFAKSLQQENLSLSQENIITASIESSVENDMANTG